MSCIYKYKGKDYTKDEFYSLVRTTMVQPRTVQKYKKVLFPSGNTASRIEGHTTLEEFKKQKEDRIKSLEESFSLPVTNDTKEDLLDLGLIKKDFTEEQIKQVRNKDKQNEINQLKQELERVETEGFGALKPIWNFYENTVANILKKQGLNPVLITDEYGNTWNEIILTEEQKKQILLSKQGEIDYSKTELPSNIYQSYKHELLGQAVALSTKDTVSSNLKRIADKLLDWIKDSLSKLGFIDVSGIKTFSDLKKVFEENNLKINLGKNNISLAKRILDYQNQNKGKDDFVTRLIDVDLAEDRKDGVDLDFITINNFISRAINNDEKNDLIDSLYNLYQTNPDLVNDLFDYTLLTTGFNRTSVSMIDWFPIEIFEAKGLIDWYKNEVNYELSNEEIESFVDNYVRNNMDELPITRVYNKKQLDELNNRSSENEIDYMIWHPTGQLYKGSLAYWIPMSKLGYKNYVKEYGVNTDTSMISINNTTAKSKDIC